MTPPQPQTPAQPQPPMTPPSFQAPQQVPPQSTQAPAPQQQLDPNNEIVQGMNNQEAVINDLMMMGFDRELIKQALTAAFFNRERAIDYLLNVFSLGNPRRGYPTSIPGSRPASGPTSVKYSAPARTRTVQSGSDHSRTSSAHPTTHNLTCF